MGVKIFADGGINHNGDISMADILIVVAVVSGCDYPMMPSLSGLRSWGVHPGALLNFCD